MKRFLRDRDNDGVDVDSISFTYQTNQINTQWHTPRQDRTEFYYNNLGVLTGIKHKGDLGIVSDEIINYDSSSNIKQLNVTTDYFNSETNREYEYDTKITRPGTNSSENYINEIYYEYNSSNYPVSSQTELNGILLK